MQRVPVAQLTPAPWNPRTLRDARFKSLCASLQADPAFLELRPILATSDGVVYGGNQRLRAAMRLGWPDVPAILSDIPDQLARERALKDNNTWGEWQEDDLAALVYDLSQQGTSPDTLGFEPKDLTRLLDSVGALGEADDVVPAPPAEPITRRGDLWLLGPHRLLCGDATRPEDVRRLMGGSTPRLLVTDPPYGVNYDPTWRDRAQANRLGTGRDPIPSGDETFHDWSPAFSHDWLEVAYCWAPPGAQQYLTQQMLEAAGFIVRQQIIWAKPMAPLSRSNYHWRHEPCWYAVRKGRTAGWIGGHAETTVWEAASPTHIMSGSDEEATPHATQKPVECMARPIKNHEGDVYDPFLGSGTTLVAAHTLGRVCYGLEIEPRYCDVSVQRWERLTGETATREAALAVA